MLTKLLAKIPRRWCLVGGLYFLANLSDILTTMTTPWEEANPLFRDVWGRPVLHQILAGKGTWSLGFAICIISLWWALEDDKIRKVLDRLALTYITYCSFNMFQSAVNNWFIHKGWYHP